MTYYLKKSEEMWNEESDEDIIEEAAGWTNKEEDMNQRNTLCFASGKDRTYYNHLWRGVAHIWDRTIDTRFSWEENMQEYFCHDGIEDLMW